jgi:hypothetical protein
MKHTPVLHRLEFLLIDTLAAGGVSDLDFRKWPVKRS